ncbi:MAG TPA: PilZ domain-containing protein [Xanthobacteraceae bacterium]|jgi:hypothetical protein|nr:PilZ domain-containing protein [Xanthobacteraceae bacterium]
MSVFNLRRSPRNRVRCVATIKLGAGATPRHCLVTDISAEGVRLQVKDLDDLDEFVLFFNNVGGPARDGTYKVVWKDGNDVGAEFVDAANGRD